VKHTKAALENLATIFSGAALQREIYIASLQSLVRLAITEYATQPLKDAQADMARIDEILAASKKAP
jgi:hypothetical protein